MHPHTITNDVCVETYNSHRIPKLYNMKQTLELVLGLLNHVYPEYFYFYYFY